MAFSLILPVDFSQEFSSGIRYFFWDFSKNFLVEIIIIFFWDFSCISTGTPSKNLSEITLAVVSGFFSGIPPRFPAGMFSRIPFGIPSDFFFEFLQMVVLIFVRIFLGIFLKHFYKIAPVDPSCVLAVDPYKISKATTWEIPEDTSKERNSSKILKITFLRNLRYFFFRNKSQNSRNNIRKCHISNFWWP